jgi:mono/diheme cytochrome c family protein
MPLVIAAAALVAAVGGARASASQSANEAGAPRAVAQDMISSDSGAYTEEQAERGLKVYNDTCGACHVTEEFSDNNFKGLWNAQPVFMLFEQIRETMPQDNPGGMPRNEYVDVVTYLLKLNAAPPGKAELPTDSAGMARFRMDLKKPAASTGSSR